MPCYFCYNWNTKEVKRVKKWLKIIGAYLLFFVFLGLVLGGVGYYLYQNGWIEKQLSTISIPFDWFAERQIEPVGHLEVKDTNRPPIEALKEAIDPLNEQVKANYREKPSIDELALTDESRQALQEQIDLVYNQPHTYIAEAKVVGLLLRNNGWSGLLNFAVVGDYLDYDNRVIAFQINEDGQITHLQFEFSDRQDFSYTEIPTDFDTTHLDRALLKAHQNFTDIGLQKTEDPLLLENEQYLKNAVISQLQFVHSYVRVYVTTSIGTDEGIKEHITIYHLDEP